MAALVTVCALAAILGFAAHRASLCTVRAVAELMSSRRAFMLISVGKSILWASAITLPFFLLSGRSVPPAGAWQLSGLAMLGGFTFGVGAALNGACVYSTMTRLADGEVRMLVTVIGFGLGVAGFLALVDLKWLSRPAAGLPQARLLVGWLSVAALLALAVYEAVCLWRTRPAGVSMRELLLAKQYRLSTAAMLIGLSAGLILVIEGPYGYASTLQQGIEAALGRRAAPESLRWLLLACALAGMLASTLQRKSFRLDWRPRAMWLMNLTGGVLMGLGVALTPGGNDSLVLYAIPLLSPHALPAYAALAGGVAAGLLAVRLALGLETRAECRDDLYFGVTRKIEKRAQRPITARRAPSG
jgi:uncharacterized membrane protein YedE/YeeE